MHLGQKFAKLILYINFNNMLPSVTNKGFNKIHVLQLKN